ncbi:DNA fragmentation factor subunit alpha [Phlebotomus papatasi]|uniref:DNA fragmentation factor subunit alpha n=1 Tax=Phlebotomus papatasi TaxID=29031 RepID=UPI0024839D8A|nr:DNA fragmentation factor subunit alpha [Phlebotomus papatasi]
MDTTETIPTVETDNRKPYKVKDVTRNIKKAVVAATLEEVKTKSAEKFGRSTEVLPTIHLDSDGTEIDDEEYFQTLEANAELIAVFSGEQWMDPTHYVTITTRRDSADSTDCADVERVHLKKLVGQLKNNLCSVSVLSEPDLELLSNMDPNSLADITGKDFIEQLKEASGRLLHEKRQAFDAIELLRMLAKERGITLEVHHDISDAIIVRERNSSGPSLEHSTNYASCSETKRDAPRSKNSESSPAT